MESNTNRAAARADAQRQRGCCRGRGRLYPAASHRHRGPLAGPARPSRRAGLRRQAVPARRPGPRRRAFDAAARRAVQTKAGPWTPTTGTSNNWAPSATRAAIRAGGSSRSPTSPWSAATTRDFVRGSGIRSIDWVPAANCRPKPWSSTTPTCCAWRSTACRPSCATRGWPFSCCLTSSRFLELRAAYSAILDPSLERLNTSNFKKAFSALFAADTLVSVGHRPSAGKVGRPGEQYRFVGPVAGTRMRELPWGDSVRTAQTTVERWRNLSQAMTAASPIERTF